MSGFPRYGTVALFDQLYVGELRGILPVLNCWHSACNHWGFSFAADRFNTRKSSVSKIKAEQLIRPDAKQYWTWFKPKWLSSANSREKLNFNRNRDIYDLWWRESSQLDHIIKSSESSEFKLRVQTLIWPPTLMHPYRLLSALVRLWTC